MLDKLGMYTARFKLESPKVRMLHSKLLGEPQHDERQRLYPIESAGPKGPLY